MSWKEIETDIRYLQQEEYGQESERIYVNHWPEVANAFERKLAANIWKPSRLSLELGCFVRVVGLACQLRDSIITLDLEWHGERIEARVFQMVRSHTVVPPITSDGPDSLAFALRWFGARALPCRLSISPDNLFWIPLD